jgi:acetylornithine deacetylase/succinyl-diaminopimelate desuccinylase-like protein
MPPRVLLPASGGRRRGCQDDDGRRPVRDVSNQGRLRAAQLAGRADRLVRGGVRGAAMAGAYRLEIGVKGCGGHAAMPHRTRDPIVAAAEIVLAAQTIVSRVIDPLDPAVISITSIHAGEAYNVISGQVDLRVGFCAFSNEVGQRIEAELHRICADDAATHGIDVKVRASALAAYPPTINQPPRSRSTRCGRPRAPTKRTTTSSR